MTGARILLLLALIMAAVVDMSACIVEGGEDGEGCVPGFSDGFPCAEACDASEVVFINGENYCTSTCGVGNTCPSGHVCVRFGEDDTADSACLPPCSTGSDCPSGFEGICSVEGVCGI